MPLIKSQKRKYTDLIICPDEIIELASLCYDPWKRELRMAQNKWRTVQLPEIERLIDKHNKDVKAKKSVYSFNTYQTINESDKQAIIEKEKDFFIFTSQHVYVFRSSFELGFGNKTIKNTTPLFLSDEDLTKVTRLDFSTETERKNKSIRILIKNTNNTSGSFQYEITSSDYDWFNKTVEKIESILQKVQKPNKITYYKWWIALVLSSLLSLTMSKILIYFNVFGFIKLLKTEISNFIFLSIFFLFIMVVIDIKIDENLPRFAIKEEYEPFNNNLTKIFIFVIAAVISPFIWDLIKLVYGLNFG